MNATGYLQEGGPISQHLLY